MKKGRGILLLLLLLTLPVWVWGGRVRDWPEWLWLGTELECVCDCELRQPVLIIEGIGPDITGADTEPVKKGDSLTLVGYVDGSGDCYENKYVCVLRFRTRYIGQIVWRDKTILVACPDMRIKFKNFKNKKK